MLQTKQERVYHQLKEWIENHQLYQEQPLPSYRTLAKQFGTSLKIIQKAIERLKQEGIIYSIPHVGACYTKPFLSTQPYSPKKNVRLRIYIQEHTLFSGVMWRSLIKEFELCHPHIHIELSQHPFFDPMMAPVDLLWMETLSLQHHFGKDLYEWIDDSIQAKRYLSPVEYLLKTGTKTYLPIAVSGFVLFVNRHRLQTADLYTPEQWTSLPSILWTCREYFRRTQTENIMGCVLNGFHYPLWKMRDGSSSDKFILSHHLLMEYLELLEQSGKELVTPNDFSHGVDVNITRYILQNDRCLFLLGLNWQEKMMNPKFWESFPWKGTEPCRFGSMSLGILKKSPHLEEAILFARFLVEESAQKLLASNHGYIPTLFQAALAHPYGQTFQDHCNQGWISSCIKLDLPWVQAWEEIEQILAEVRSYRLGSEEAFKRIIDLPYQSPILAPSREPCFCDSQSKHNFSDFDIQ